MNRADFITQMVLGTMALEGQALPPDDTEQLKQKVRQKWERYQQNNCGKSTVSVAAKRIGTERGRNVVSTRK